MPICEQCGEDNPERARFCLNCAAPLQATAPSREIRKTVTVVFADMTGSTAMGERLDPETLRRVMGRYYDALREVLERHGGTVEKFIGDAVMAVFGIPVVHEDDAMRAVRAAADVREELARLNAELERDHGVTIEIRTGVNTGEVVTGAGTGDSLATGDAVNVAARLEQAAPPGEILIGQDTYRMVRDAVEVDAVDPLTLKGKAEPVPAYRLRSVAAGVEGLARHLDSPMIGRDRERQLLAQAFDRSIDESTCHLFTVLGAAGVGKSRLVAEFLASLGDTATVLRGRCLPYGEGITYWPITEIVTSAAGIAEADSPEEAKGKLFAILEGAEDGALVGERVSQVIGLGGSGAPEETFWAVRRMFETLAARRPVVVVVDDIHWAEPTLLDLIDHIADWVRDTPILLLCMARPELIDARPGWAGGKMNATSILVEPLTEADCDLLVDNLLGGVGLPSDVRGRILQAAEGNPLFVEEMLGMLIDDGLLRRDDGQWVPTGKLSSVTVPPTIHALLEARLDRLDPAERTVLERGSVEGKTFHRGAVVDLGPEATAGAVSGLLRILTRKELIRPSKAEFVGEDAFRFRHLLIRDAAYDAMPKEVRADLHERFADWLARIAGDRVTEYEEIVGYHLEQCCRYRQELGRLDEVTIAVGERAANLLGQAGSRAARRGDVPASITLLARAVGLAPLDGVLRLALRPPLAEALWLEGDFARAAAVASDAKAAADAASDRWAAARARIEGTFAQLAIDPKLRAMDDLVAEIAEDIRALEEAGDEFGLGRAWALRSHIGNIQANFALMAESAKRAIEHGTRSGAPALPFLGAYGAALAHGPTPVGQALHDFEDVMRAFPPGRLIERGRLQVLAELRLLSGDLDQAREAIASSSAISEELGGGVLGILDTWLRGQIERTARDLPAAERYLREAYDQFAVRGERAFLSTLACDLGHVLHDQGRDDEALELSVVSEDSGSEEDLGTQFMWRDLRARVLAGRGEVEEAEQLSREAVRLSDLSDGITFQAEMRMGYAEVELAAGRRGEAVQSLAEALERAERKGAALLASRIRERLRDLEGKSLES